MSGTRLSGNGFKRAQLAGLEKAEVIAQFGGQGLIGEVEGVIGDGKEATVYLCTAHPSVGVEYLAAKVYRPTRFRAFRGGNVYAGERMPLASRAKCRLYDAGADVPEPLARSQDAILMEFVGDGEGAGPQLRHVDLAPEQARATLDRLLRNVEIFLDLHLVHGDLSAYNVLWHADKAWIIDVPQSLNLHTRHDGFEYLKRDLENLGRYFARYGLRCGDFAERAWSRYRRGELGR
jgi:RIO kinase 1